MKNKLKIALGIISGRVDVNNLNTEDYYDLGYDPYTFSAFGTPDMNEIKSKAENILIDALMEK